MPSGGRLPETVKMDSRLPSLDKEGEGGGWMTHNSGAHPPCPLLLLRRGIIFRADSLSELRKEL